MENDDSASEDPSTVQSSVDIVAGYSHDGLKLITVLDSTKSESDTDNTPDIDVVHVMAVGAEETRLTLETLFLESVTARRREFLFSGNISSFLDGEFTGQSVDRLARQLLQSLIFFQRHDEQKARRAIVFVAYDFGALIVKRAICIAGANDQQWPGIFASTAWFIFSGCFQGVNNTQLLYSKIFEYLVSQKNSSFLGSTLTPASLNSLAKYTVENAEGFIASKITVRSQIISLYSNVSGQGKISDVFDCDTATIGVPNEITMQEQIEEGKESFPYLRAKLCSKIDIWPPYEAWIPFEQTLLALTPAHYPLSSTYVSDSSSVATSTEYKEWMASAGPHILCVCGDDYNGITKAAEQTFLHWRRELREREQSERAVLPFSFVFSSRDPMRRSMKDMLGSLLLSSLAMKARDRSDDEYSFIKDQLTLHHAWSEMDLFKLFKALSTKFLSRDRLLLLQHIDECDRRSREAFWSIVSSFAVINENPFKIVVTCGRSFNLLDELRHWPDIPVNLIKKNLEGSSRDEYRIDSSILCRNGCGETEVQEKLEELKPMTSRNLNRILELIMDIANWPSEPSPRTFHDFYSHFKAVTVESTPADILDKVLRGIADQVGLRWVLNWLLNRQRPLSYDELSMVLCHCKRGETHSLQTPSAFDLRDARSQLQIWFRGITESCSSQVAIRESIREYLQDDSKYVWTEATSSDAITAFLLDYLSASETQQRLDFLNSQYHARIQSSSDEITPPLVSDGRDIIFYAIQALPYHLSESPAVLRTIRDTLTDTNGKLMSWARVYWAMSNPFSRPEFEALKTPYETLLELENLGPEAVAILKEVLPLTNQATVYRVKLSAISLKMNSLSKAIREGNENMALSLAGELISASKPQEKAAGGSAALKDSSKIAWPSWFLWRAVWLNMIRLVTLLLNDGMDPDPSDRACEFFPSPLYMAARLCHSEIMDALIEHGAKLDVIRSGQFTTIYTAAGSGNVHGVASMIAKDSSLLEKRAPETPLYIASFLGYWTVVKKLLELGADPNSGIGERPNDLWAPLIVAAEFGHVKTARILLEHKADPNIVGPSNVDTPLWFAAVRAASVELIRLLLDNGADLNHELLSPSLLIEIASSTLPAKDKLTLLDFLDRRSPPIQVNVVGPNGMTPLLHGADRGELPVVKWLLEHDADVNATDNEGRSALYYALDKIHVEVVRELLNWKPQLNNLSTEGYTLLSVARGNISMVRMLLDAGADVNLPSMYNYTILNTAARMERTELVKLLIDRKANVNHRAGSGWNSVMFATRYNMDAEILRILSEAGANLDDAVDSETGYTLLHLATWTEIEFTRVLLEFRKSIDLEKRDNQGRTAFLLAARNGNVEHVKLLVRAGADINVLDPSGYSALSGAARGYLPLEGVDLLLSQPDIKIDLAGDSIGTALMVACEMLNLEMVTKLLAHGADPNISVTNGYGNTALKIACMPWQDDDDTVIDKDKLDGIIRELVGHGADVNAMGGSTIYNAICAAAFSADVSTINLFLEKGASVQDPDPLGRLPIHFAAANGIKNFEAVALVHRGDLLVCDRFGKNALHWAAQFGHAETVTAILNHPTISVKDREQCINQGDVDGWTPLCWATRPIIRRFGWDSTSESPEYIKTVKILLDHGADRSVTFTMGTRENVETFTPLQMAKLCSAEGEMINMLDTGPDGNSISATARKSSDTNKQVKRYKSSTAICNVCLNTIYGYSYQCQSCPDFDACKKCYYRVDSYHISVDLEDKKHVFAFRKDHDQEFEDVPTPDSPVSQVGSEVDSTERSRERSNDDELRKNVEDEVDEQGLGALDDLDELVVEDDGAYDGASP